MRAEPGLWEQYLVSIGEDPSRSRLTCESWHFCDNKEDADELALLALQGSKRATAGLYDAYIAEGEPLPRCGEHHIITDWDENPVCIIRFTNIEILPFKDVNETHAKIEGEGDRSLDYWVAAHQKAFGSDARELGIPFNEDSLVVFIHFDRVYPEDYSNR
jgi:uncharacterized protein YhfF